MQLITRMKVLAGLGAAAAALVMTVPTIASAAPVSEASSPTTAVQQVSGVSSAAVPLPPCGNGTLCTFKDANYRNGGSRWNFNFNSHPHNLWFYVGTGVNDQISSFYNHRAWTSYFSQNCPATFPVLGAHRNSAISNLAAISGGWNDSISAIGLGTNNGIHIPAHWHHRGGC